MKKVIAVLCILCLLVLPVFANGAKNGGKQSAHIPRVVFVLYDDSASMYEGYARWAYASYAMQSLCAMMDETDYLYVMYLNGDNLEIDLGIGKRRSIENFASIVYGGPTPDKVTYAANKLIDKYKEYQSLGISAKYYLLALSDGDIQEKGQKDPTPVANRLLTEADRVKKALSGADFDYQLFDMRKYTANERLIIDDLRTISSGIMGKEEIGANLSGGKLTFTLKYPAANIVVYGQKENGKFSNGKVAVKYGSVSKSIDPFIIKCPEGEPARRPGSTLDKPIVSPSNPPSGIVTIIDCEQGKHSLPKGTYTVDLSAYDLNANEVVVLAEPAVAVNCRFYIGNDKKPLTFEETEEQIRAGQKLTVVCGLYEIDENGNVTNNEVDVNTLKRTYNVTLNGQELKKVAGKDNEFTADIEESHSNSKLSVKATVSGYAPFGYSKTFGTILRVGDFGDKTGSTETLKITKPVFRKLVSGDYKVKFVFNKIDGETLGRDYSIVSSYTGFPSGKCSDLSGGALKLSGNEIEVKIDIPDGETFGAFPNGATLSLKDEREGKILYTYRFEKQNAAYKIGTDNQFAEGTVTLQKLESNTSPIVFTLLADYDGSGNFVKINPEYEDDIPGMTVDDGGLPGKTEEETGKTAFIPQKTGDLSAFAGNTYKISASATVDGQAVKSDEITVGFSSVSYRITVQNEITEEFKLEMLKDNEKKILFKLEADYDGSGRFGELADWDHGKYVDLEIIHDTMPGTVGTYKDSLGNTVGILFTPQYDENDNKGIVYTRIVARTHKISAVLKNTDISAEAEISVAAPVFTIKVKNDGITIVDTELLHNERSVDFMIFRDDKVLTREELEGLAPYSISYSNQGNWVCTDTETALNGDNEAYLRCIPTHKESGVFNGLFDLPHNNLFACVYVKPGESIMTLAIGENRADAKLTFKTDILWLTVFTVTCIILIYALYAMICNIFMRRFSPGKVTTFILKRKSGGYSLSASYSNGKSGYSTLSLVGPVNMICPGRPCLPRRVMLGSVNIKLKVDTGGGGWFSAPVAMIPKNMNGSGTVLRYVDCSKDGESYTVSEIDMTPVIPSEKKGKKKKEEFYECKLGSAKGIALLENGVYKKVILFVRKNDNREIIGKITERKKRK